MERSHGRLVAVSAEDVGEQVPVLLRHRGLGDLLVVHAPDIRHVHHAHAAHWARELAVADHVVKASFVDEVIAGRDLGGDAGGVDVLLTHWAVGARHPLNTLVRALQSDS